MIEVFVYSISSQVLMLSQGWRSTSGGPVFGRVFSTATGKFDSALHSLDMNVIVKDVIIYTHTYMYMYTRVHLHTCTCMYM